MVTWTPLVDLLLNGRAFCHHHQVASLQQKIVTEDRAVESRTQDYLSDWERTKPVEGHMRPDDALQRLQLFEVGSRLFLTHPTRHCRSLDLGTTHFRASTRG